MSAALMALSKRECLGVAMVLTGAAAVTVFVGNVVDAWQWRQNPELGPKLEPRTVFSSAILPLLLAATSFLFHRLRAKIPGEATGAPGSALPVARPERLRGIVMANVRREWIASHQRAVLSPAGPIPLRVEEATDAIVFSRLGDVQEGERRRLTDESLPALFAESTGNLLILGDPGCGKTFTLVWLAERLLARAEADPAAPVPVVVPLASWANDQKPLDQWLGRELVRSGLTAHETAALLAERSLVLLLDGLDEVREDARAACVEAIRHFKATFQTGLALCCRDEEYRALGHKFTSGLGLRVLPIGEAQVEEYFAGFGPALAPLRQARQEQPELRSLGNTPLMLHVLTRVATAGGGMLALPAGSSLVAWRDAIFTRYVEHAFARREVHDAESRPVPSLPCSTAQAVHYLQQIARRLEGENRTRLYLEQLQPAWVTHRWRYGLLVGLSYGLMFGIWTGPGAVLLLGLATAVWFGLTDNEVDLVESIRFRFRWQPVVAGVVVGLISGLIAWAYYDEFYQFLYAVLGVSLMGLIVGLFETGVDPEPAQPNQGVRHSLRMAGAGGALFGWVGWGIAAGLRWGITLPIGGWLIGFVLLGGLGVIQHYAIRLALAWESALPYPLRDRKLIALLDALRDRILLVRRGGGWDFYHGLLREFLAEEPFGHTPAEVARRLGGENSPASLPAAKASMTG